MKTHLIAILLVLMSVAGYAQEDSPVPYITVAGNAETWVEPDVAIWAVRIEKTGRNLADLQRQSDADLDLLLETLSKMGISQGAVTSGRITVRKEYQQAKVGRGDFKGYVLSRVVDFEQGDVMQYEEFLRQLMGEAGLDATPQFRFAAEDSIRTLVHLAAVRNAREKAVAMAAELGSRVGPPLIISEYPIITDYQQVTNLAMERGTILRLQPQRVRFASTVYVRFALEPGTPDS
ncbi:MAG: SIMPL domain-containing protein [Candidatus Krumholzibacteria bacterium]|nr:SIMPL domain-containing protein [Candidatus Krumholzibacteria bacterium]